MGAAEGSRSDGGSGPRTRRTRRTHRTLPPFESLSGRDPSPRSASPRAAGPRRQGARKQRPSCASCPSSPPPSLPQRKGSTRGPTTQRARGTIMPTSGIGRDCGGLGRSPRSARYSRQAGRLAAVAELPGRQQGGYLHWNQAVLGPGAARSHGRAVVIALGADLGSCSKSYHEARVIRPRAAGGAGRRRRGRTPDDDAPPPLPCPLVPDIVYAGPG